MTEPNDQGEAMRAFFAFGLLWRSILHSVPKSGSVAGLQGPQLHVFFVLAHGPARSMSELAEVAGTSSANLTGIIDRLEERGLIERVRSETDRRVVLVRLTEQGAETHDAMEAVVRERVRELTSALTAEEQREFTRLTSKMMSATGAEAWQPCETHRWTRGAVER